MKKVKSHFIAKRISCIMLAFMLLFGTGTIQGNDYAVCTVQAATKSQQKAAKAAFRKFLSTRQIRWANGSRYYDRSKFRFRYMTVGSSNTPILLVSCSATAHYEGYNAVYCYVNGKVKCLGVNDGIGKVYQKAGILTMWHSGGGYGEVNTWYYRISKNGTMKQIAFTSILTPGYESLRSLFGKDIYKVNGKKVSKTTFRQTLKKWTGSSAVSKTPSTVSTYANTAANRKKYLS